MATSAIGPGFLTQTAVFTQDLLTSFGFVILVSVLIDIGVQLNIWRIITMSETRAQDLANRLVPGLGVFLAVLIVFGGLIFNTGNIGGTGLGLQILTGLSPKAGALISCVMALTLFWLREAGRAIDLVTRVLGLLMIGLTVYVAFVSHPPLGAALKGTVWPDKIDELKIVTLVGGTVGGYISFAGAHRLLDAGISGKAQLPAVNRSSVSGILITSVMRFILFLAALGVVWSGAQLDPANPPASVFRIAAGMPGYYFFGLVLWCAAITSVIGASYTSVSFLKTLHPWLRRQEKLVTSMFIVLSCFLFLVAGRPVRLLVFAGAANGIILPLALAVILLIATRKSFFNVYQHPKLLQWIGWIIVAVMGWMSVRSLEAAWQVLR